MHIPDEGFREAVHELVESERDNKRVEAASEFSILTDCGLSKLHYRLYHIWCLDLENMKDFIGKVWDYKAKNTTL